MRSLDVGGAGADGANSSFRRRMLSMSTCAWISVKIFSFTSAQVQQFATCSMGKHRYLNISTTLRNSSIETPFKVLQAFTSFPLVSPPSNHSTVTLCTSEFTPDITAEWIRPLDRWISTLISIFGSGCQPWYQYSFLKCREKVTSYAPLPPLGSRPSVDPFCSTSAISIAS